MPVLTMPTVILTGYTQFIQKVTLTKLLRDVLGTGLKQARDEVDQLLQGGTIRIARDSMAEATALWRDVTAIGISVAISDEAGHVLNPSPAGERIPPPQGNDIIIGPDWVKWDERAGAEPEAIAGDLAKAYRVLQACQELVDSEQQDSSGADHDENTETARFAAWLTSMADPDTYALLTAGHTDVVASPVLTQFGFYVALVQDSKVYAAIRCL